MALNFNYLPPAQRAVAERIASIGFQHGYSEKIISAALQLCNQESGLGKDIYNNHSGAKGIWQYLSPAHIQAQLAEFKSRHPDSPISLMSASAVLADTNASTQVVLSTIETWQRDFANHYIPATLGHKMHARPCAERLFEDFDLYVMYRHNTSASQTQNKYLCHDGILANQQAVADFLVEVGNKIAHESPIRMWAAGNQGQVLHEGRGAIRLPNGMSFVLTQVTDSVTAVNGTAGSSYLIRQGNTQTAILPSGTTIVSRPSAFHLHDPHTGHRQYMNGIGAELLQLPDGNIAVKPANSHFAPFVVKTDGKYEDLQHMGLGLNAPPLRSATNNQLEKALLMSFQAANHGLLNPHQLNPDAQYQLASASLIPHESTHPRVLALLGNREMALQQTQPEHQKIVLAQFDTRAAEMLQPQSATLAHSETHVQDLFTANGPG